MNWDKVIERRAKNMEADADMMGFCIDAAFKALMNNDKCCGFTIDHACILAGSIYQKAGSVKEIAKEITDKEIIAADCKRIAKLQESLSIFQKPRK